jgi:hypothetical protein
MINRGNSGIIERASLQGQTVIIKSAQKAPGPGERCQRDEARFMSMVPPHPNVLPLLGVLPHPCGGLSLVCPYAPGGTLQELCVNESKLVCVWLECPANMRHIALAVCRAVSALHSVDLIHSDSTSIVVSDV